MTNQWTEWCTDRGGAVFTDREKAERELAWLNSEVFKLVPAHLVQRTVTAGEWEEIRDGKANA